MGMNLFEQETVINFMRDCDIAEVYTSDSTVMTRLDKLVENPDAPDWNLKKEHYDQKNNLVAKTYTTKKRLISFRAATGENRMSEEQKEAARDRLRRYWMSKSEDAPVQDEEDIEDS